MRNRVLVLSALIAGMAVALWMARSPSSIHTTAGASRADAPAKTQSAKASSSEPSTVPSAGSALPAEKTMTPANEMSRVIEAAAADLSDNADRASAQAILAELHQKLAGGRDRAETVSAILDFLDSDADAKTGLEFKVGPGHALSESPSLRVALLDWLSEMDRDAAAEYAEKIFSEKRSADEWAIALRNYANGSAPDTRRLESWTLELIRHTPWLENPSAGFLEAFDTAVHLKSSRLVGEFSRLLEPRASVAVKHASFVALDRLALAAPREALREIANDKALAQQTGLRVALMTRADVRDTEQLATVEAYLRRRDLTKAEIEQFGGLFPNVNFFLSHNLLTKSATLNWKDSAARDLASLKQAGLWKARGELRHLSTTFAEIESRLTRRVQSAIRGGLLAENSIGNDVR